VLQVALPLQDDTLMSPVIIGPHGNVVVKIFIFGPKEAYELFSQDSASAASGQFCCLDLLSCAPWHLPSPQTQLQSSETSPQGPRLPTLTIALLEAGGWSLISPPNVPHMVLTTQHCVMVEQRKIFFAFLDEVYYFLIRARQSWGQSHSPIVYKFISETLQDSDAIHNEILPPIFRLQNTPLRILTLKALIELNKAGEVRVAEKDLRSIEAELGSATNEAHVMEAAHRIANLDRLVAVSLNCPPYVADLSLALCSDATSFAACVHAGGKVRFGPLRGDVAHAERDANKLLEAFEHGTFERTLKLSHSL